MILEGKEKDVKYSVVIPVIRTTLDVTRRTWHEWVFDLDGGQVKVGFLSESRSYLSSSIVSFGNSIHSFIQYSGIAIGCRNE